jgi:hypothetical protein
MPKTAGAKPPPPTTVELAERLGPAGPLWLELRDAIGVRCGPLTERWVYGGRKYGWSCRLERGKTGFYLIPDTGHFRVGLALSDTARAAALDADLPPAIHDELAAAVRVMEGWPVRLSVRTASDLESALLVTELKFSS